VKIGVVGPSFVIPEVEFRMGLAQIKEAGISTVVHRQCKKRHRFFAGTDEERARAFFEFAIDPRFSAVWCGRGGYGAARILPLLEKMAADRGVPERKLLLGYSDATALIEFVRTRWGWETLHSPMPGMRKFCAQTQSEWKSLVGFITGDRKHQAPWEKKPLKFAGKKPSLPVEGQLVGGNLTVWTSLLGTPYAPMPKNKILFFEDTDESLYRLDRMAQQLWMAGGLKGARAIVPKRSRRKNASCSILVPRSSSRFAASSTRIKKFSASLKTSPTAPRSRSLMVCPSDMVPGSLPCLWVQNIVWAGTGRSSSKTGAGADNYSDRSASMT
jgi:muramoyltetrapeptide carboxypeptidase